MSTVLCSGRAWLTSEEAFSIYAPCMYQPTYDAFVAQMEEYFSDPSVKIFVCEKEGEKIGVLVLKEDGSEAEILGIAVKRDGNRLGLSKKNKFIAVTTYIFFFMEIIFSIIFFHISINIKIHSFFFDYFIKRFISNI